ncbi:MAG: hypothetical protein ACXABH_12740 [Candidatus Thorarchaeota archaeon]
MTSNLKENYNRAATILKGNDSKENTTLIHRTPWVRIMLEQDQEESGSFFLEVEMSLPESTKKVDVDSSELIDTLSEHLQYLQKLRDVGFDLSVIDTGCIYCASKEVKEPLEDNLFRVLLPP